MNSRALIRTSNFWITQKILLNVWNARLKRLQEEQIIKTTVLINRLKQQNQELLLRYAFIASDVTNWHQTLSDEASMQAVRSFRDGLVQDAKWILIILCAILEAKEKRAWTFVLDIFFYQDFQIRNNFLIQQNNKLLFSSFSLSSKVK